MENNLKESANSVIDDTEDDNIVVENEPDPEDVTQEINNCLKEDEDEKDEKKEFLVASLTEEELKRIPVRFENSLILNEEVKTNSNKNEQDTNEFSIKPRPKISPFLLFINPKSGGQLGDSLFKAFKEHLHTVQVRDLASEKGPKKGLLQFSEVPNTRVIACGGDGTAGWVLNVLDTMNINPRPPVGVIPLGTGNDLARTLGWGGGFDKVKASKEVLNLLASSEVVNLDRWKITFNGEAHGYLPVVNNYFSIGIDAKIALKFHEKREANPENFSSQTMNKIKYGAYGALESTRGLQSRIEVEIDGKQIKLPSIQGIIVLNLPSWAGGTDLWNFAKSDEKKGWKENKIDDGLFEVVGIKSSFHIGQIKGHMSKAVKLGQGSKLKITLKETDFCQIDGEPWKQVVENNQPCVIDLSLFNNVPMLSRKRKSVKKQPFAESEGGEKEEKFDTDLKKILILNHQIKHIENNNSNNNNEIIVEDKFTISIREGTTPFCSFINPLSGGQLGDALFKSLRKYLHETQVWPLGKNQPPSEGLEYFAKITDTRVVACGGDGTAGWVLNALDSMKIEPRPPVGVIPLGTGNDLARTLGWGGGFDKVNTLKHLLLKLEKSEIIQLDRWKITFNGEAHGYLPVVNNYFSIGIDAKIAYKFHEKREANPENFSSQTMNKIKYGAYGATESVKGLEKEFKIKIDGKEKKIPSIQGIIVLNLPSWAGGTDLWNFAKSDEKKGWKENKIDDGLFEVVGIKSSMHIARIKGKISRGAIKIGQGKKLEIELKAEHYCQIDGEPWKQAPCTIVMEHFNSVPMLKKKK